MSSVFGLGEQTGVDSARLDTSLVELTLLTNTFNNLLVSCQNKCISTRYNEPDLNKGESTCLDRCVAKFFGVHKVVEERVQAQGATPDVLHLLSIFDHPPKWIYTCSAPSDTLRWPLCNVVCCKWVNIEEDEDSNRR